MKKLIFMAIAISLFSCSKDESSDSSNTNNTSDLNLIKAVGYKSTSNTTNANILWNGTQNISFDTKQQYSKIFVKGTDIYFLSTQTNPNFPNDYTKNLAGYYKNGTFVTLGEGFITYDILVDDNNDVHVCGYDNKVGGGLPTYWKNGQKTTLPGVNNRNAGKAISIVKSGSDIYISGYASYSINTDQFGYWKNGVFTGLGITAYYSGQEYESIQIDVVGNTTYLSAYQNNTLKIYTNSTSSTIADSFDLEKIKYHNEKLYLVGTFYENNTSKAVYYENGVRKIISPNPSKATDIAFKGSDIYFSGQENQKPAIWKNNSLLNDQSEFTTFSIYSDLSF